MLNHPTFANPASNFQAGNAGTISSLMPFTPMRQLQLGIEGKILTTAATPVAVVVMAHPLSAAPHEVPPSLVRAELDRVLGSEIFSRSDRLSAFLRFIVEETLAGHGAGLKEQVIAVELYSKGADFNTAADPIVRVDARRLRDKLREYLRGSPAWRRRHLDAERQLHAAVRARPMDRRRLRRCHFPRASRPSETNRRLLRGRGRGGAWA